MAGHEPEVDIEGLGVERLALRPDAAARVTESAHATHHARPPLAALRRRGHARASSRPRPPRLPPHTLMQRAGLAVARLALALAPHARTIWIACGPGNNGGDGFEAAMHLRQWGKHPVVTWLGDEARAPADALASLQRAREAGVAFAGRAAGAMGPGHRRPAGPGQHAAAGRRDGATGPRRMSAAAAPVLAVDLPSGLDADTGAGACRARRPTP